MGPAGATGKFWNRGDVQRRIEMVRPMDHQLGAVLHLPAFRGRQVCST